MKKQFLCLALAFVLCLSTAACSVSSEKKDAKETTAAETTEAPAKEKVFKTSDERFQLKADEDWKDASKLLGIEDATLSISKNAEGYIALISEYKYNFSEGLSGFNKLVIKQMEKNLDNDKASESKELKLGGNDAFRTTVTGKTDDLDVAYTIYSCEINDRYIQLVCWSIDDSKEKFAEDFDKIAQTLSEAE